MIVRRDVPTIRELGVVVKLHRLEHIHNVIEPTDTHRLPANVGRAIETENGSEPLTLCLTDGGVDILHKLIHKALAVFEKPLGLADTGFLDGGEATTTCRIETSRSTTL